MTTADLSRAATATSERSRRWAIASLWLTRATAVVVMVGALAAIVWAVVTLRARPLDGVEGETLFEALRIRSGLPLYVDPLVGTADVPPSRYYVLYPPLWSLLLSLMPADLAPLLGRVVALGSYLGAVASVASVARLAKLDSTPEARPLAAGTGTGTGTATAIAAGFVLSFFALMLFGGSARPDAFALLLAAWAFTRASRRGGVDPASGVLFALALLAKPNVMGLALGAFALTFSQKPRAALQATFAGIGVGLLAAGVLSIASHGAFLEHLLRSTAQPLSLSLWVEQLALRLPFVVVPFATAVAFAWPARHIVGVRLALFALATSVAWALFSLAKIGSASNYWMEPSLAALACVATSEASRVARAAPSSRWVALAMALLLVQAVHNGVSSVRNAMEGIPLAFAKQRVLEGVRRHCRQAPRHVVMSDEPGIEMALNGRALGTPYQMGHLFARGRLPREPWLSDLAHDNVRCLVVQGDELERATPWSIEHRRFDPVVRAALRARFVLDREASAAELFVYRRSPP